ncbi:hypothetical protein CF319_g1106 [Tilletia indica]|nr:hypothetical protein CF319_g1106 [Tilletia indica]
MYVNKIIPAIQSRCTRFRFSPLETDQVQKRLNYVIANEGCKITPDGMTALLKLTRGDMRRALSVLQATHAAYSDEGDGRIDDEAVYNCTGNPRPADVRAMVQSMMKSELTTAYNSECKLDEDCEGHGSGGLARAIANITSWLVPITKAQASKLAGGKNPSSSQSPKGLPPGFSLKEYQHLMLMYVPQICPCGIVGSDAEQLWLLAMAVLLAITWMYANSTIAEAQEHGGRHHQQRVICEWRR